MTTMTNKYETPEIMMDVLRDKPYIRGGAADYSATSLIQAPQQLQLKKRYKDQLKIDARDKWNIFLGNAVHHEIEKGLAFYPEKYMLERKFTDFIMGRKVVAVVDAYDNDKDIIYDHKTCKHFAYTDDHKKEWEQQLNINAYLMQEDGFQPEQAKILALTMDWMKGQTKWKGRDEYPINPMYLFDIPLWSQADREQFIRDRLALHIESEDLPDHELPECTDDEMWAKPATFAVKKKGVYVAKRVLSTRKEAEEWMSKSRLTDLYIEERPGSRVRCEDGWCDVASVCPQYREYLEQKAELA